MEKEKEYIPQQTVLAVNDAALLREVLSELREMRNLLENLTQAVLDIRFSVREIRRNML